MADVSVGAGSGAPTEKRSRDAERSLKRIEGMAMLLDARYRIPIVNIRLGWDGILGVAPGVGDLITLGFSSYLLVEAMRMKMPKRVLAQMLANILIDTGIAIIPVVGDAFDIFFKANLRNSRLLRRQLERQAGRIEG